MSLDAMKQALEALERGETKLRYEAITALRAAIEQAQRNEFNPDWDQVEALRESLREHMAEIQRLRAAIEQAQSEQKTPAARLAEKIPARGTSLEPIVRKTFDRLYAEQDPERWSNQEPVAWVNPKWLNPKTRHWTNDTILHKPIAGWVPLYTAPRQWQGLTQREIDELWDLHHDDYGNALSATGYEHAIEAKLRERNA